MNKVISFRSTPLQWNPESTCEPGKWHEVEFYRPAQDGAYLCYFGNGNMGFGLVSVVNYDASDRKWWCGTDLPTHWMLLPEPPVSGE